MPLKELPSPVPLEGISMSRDVIPTALRQDAGLCLPPGALLFGKVGDWPACVWLAVGRVEPSLNCCSSAS